MRFSFYSQHAPASVRRLPTRTLAEPRSVTLLGWLLVGLLLFPLVAQAQKGETWSQSAAVLSVEPAADYAGGVRVDCGTQTELTVTLQNTGTVTWDGRLELGATGDSDPFRTDAAPRVALPNWVAPGDTVEVTVPLTVPADVQMSGTTEWQLVAGSTWFGDIASRKLFVVCQRDETDNARVVSHTLPELMECGSTQRVSVTMENTGTSVWRKDLLMRFGDPGNADPFALVSRVDLPVGVEIGPGQAHSFEFDIQAPEAAGTYTTDWRMVHSWVRWFGETATQQVDVTCSDYGVRFLQPREEVLESGQIFDWGVLPADDSPATFTFQVAAPDGFQGSMYDLRVVSQEGPVTVRFGAPVSELASYEVPAQEGLEIAGSLLVQKKMLQELAPGAQVPFRAVLAFDHNLGGTFQFEIVGNVQKATCNGTDNWSFTWDDYSGPFFEQIEEQQLPKQIAFRGTITNQDSMECLRIPQSGIMLNSVNAPFGVDTDLEAFGAFPLELQAGQSYTFRVLIDATVFAESGSYQANIGVSPSNSSVSSTLDIEGEFDILGPDLSVDNVSVRLLSTGESTGTFGILSLPQPVEDQINIDFEIDNGNNADMGVESLSASISGPAAAGLSYSPTPTSTSVPQGFSAAIGGQLQILPNAVPGDFTIRVDFRVTDGEFIPNFDELFSFEIVGTLVACGGGGECGPVIALKDARGETVRGTHRLNLANAGTHDLEFQISNVGDQDLTINATLGLSGDSRFTVAAQPSPTTLPPDSKQTSNFTLRFNAEGTSVDQIFATTVTIGGNGVNMPYTFRLEAKMRLPTPLVVEVIDFTVIDGEANLGTANHLPLEPVIRITNPTDKDYFINDFRVRKAQGGPLDWDWTSPVPLGDESSSAKRVPKDGGVYHAGGRIDFDGGPGDVNKPYRFDITFAYGTATNTTNSDYDLGILGDLAGVYNPSVGAPEIDCDDPANTCASNFCGAVVQLVGNSQAGSCVASGLDAYWGCLACGPSNPTCWRTCATGAVASLGCSVSAQGIVDALYAPVRDTRTCYCDSFAEYCDASYFLGYDIRNLPVGAAVNVHARCTTASGFDITRTETASVGSTVGYELLSCPQGADYQVWTAQVQTAGGSGYRCTLVNPDADDQPSVPRYNGVLNGFFSGVFNCSCGDPNGCGQLYTLVGSAQGLQAGDALTVTATLEGDFATTVTSSVTVTQNGQFQFLGPAPAADGYQLAIDNKSDYPQCIVEPTGNPIGGSGGTVDIARLTCDSVRPNVRILQPADGSTVQPTSNGTVQVIAEAGDASGIRQVKLLEDGAEIGVSTSSNQQFQFTWIPTSSGSRTLQALAENLDGLSTYSEPVTVTVTGTVVCDSDTQAPNIEFVSPTADEPVARGSDGSLTLVARVSDDTAMSHVDFFLDGGKLTVNDAGPVFTVNVPGVSLGLHTFRMVAYDVCGKQRQVGVYDFTVVQGDPSQVSGSLSSVTCTTMSGNARDQNHPNKILVEFYQGAPRPFGTLIGQVYADDMCTGSQPPDTCFSLATPAALQTGFQETVYAHARDIDIYGQPTGQWPQIGTKTVTCTGGDPPPRPVGVAASRGTFPDKVQLTWQASSGATSYKVYRGTTTQSSAATQIASVTASPYDDTSVQPNVTYYYWVAASNANGTSGLSDRVDGFAGTVIVNDHNPEGFLDAANCTNIAGWARDADTTGAIQVHLYQGGPAGGGGTILVHLVADQYRGDLPFTDKNHGFGWSVPAGTLAHGTPIYAYGINVDSAGNQGGDSQLLGGSGLTFNCPSAPPAPTGVNATDGAYLDKVRITWNASPDALWYSVWRASSNNSAQAVSLSSSVTSLSFDDTSAAQGQTYYYWVQAHSVAGTSPFSAVDSGYTYNQPVNFFLPDGSLEIADCNRIVGWTRDGDFSGAIQAHIYRDAPAGSGGTVVGHIVADQYRSDLPFVDKNHGYEWQVPAGMTIPHGTPIYVYGINVDSAGSQGGDSKLLFGSPMSYNCPANTPPVNYYQPEGTLDAADCTHIAGWARDADNTDPIQVHIYRDAPAGQGGTVVTHLVADKNRPGLPYPDTNHGFDWQVPAGTLPTGTLIYAYAINVDSHGTIAGSSQQLVFSPRVLACP